MIKLFNRILVILFFLIFIIPECFAEIKISPNRFEFKVPQNSSKKFITGAFTVESKSKQSIRFKVYPEFFNISDEGLLLATTKDAPNSLANNVRFAPNEFTVAPGVPQTVRFTLTGINNIPDGESRLVLFLEDTKTREVILNSNNKNFVPKLIVKTRAAIPIYVDKGQFLKTGEIEALNLTKKSKDLVYLINVKATGNSKLRLYGKGQIIDGKKLVSEFNIDNRAVQAGTTGKIKNIIPVNNLAHGKDYRLKVILNYQDKNSKEKHLVKEVNFKLDDIQINKEKI